MFKIKHLLLYITARIILIFHYDKKYISGRWFKDENGIIYASGWRWIVNSWKACRANKVNGSIPWPVAPGNCILYPSNIEFDNNDIDNFQGNGKYFQAFSTIKIGKGTTIANNVGIITANHDFNQLDKHSEGRPVTIGNDCWIGMNAIILPGVTLGDKTIVGAGSVVTKSFPGHCVIAGNPAKIIRVMD